MRGELLIVLRVSLERRRGEVVVGLFRGERRLETVLKCLFRIIHGHSLHVRLFHRWHNLLMIHHLLVLMVVMLRLELMLLNRVLNELRLYLLR